MAEVQTTTSSGEMTLRFIEFVRMHSQNAAHFLGKVPNPQTGKSVVNLDLAKMLIDQLAAISVKTRGNLTRDEETVINNSLTSLQTAFVEASRGQRENQTASGVPELQQQKPSGA